VITGTAQPQITRANLEPIEISFPELVSEQHRIVKILDEVFEGIAKVKENTEKNLQNTKELFESYLQSVFSNPGEGWEEKKFGDKTIFEIIDGDRGKNYPKKTDFLQNGYCLFLNTKNVRPDGFSFGTTMFITKSKDDILGNGKLKRDDVLLTTRGTIGNIAVYDETVPFDNIRINSGMLIFRPNTQKILPEYLFTIFQSGVMKSQIKEFVSGAAQPQLPIKTLINFSIPVPKSITEQKKIVAKLDALSEQTKKLEGIYKQKLLDLEELKKSVLKKAFSGEL
jgi:restriction endonuclease S subunit